MIVQARSILLSTRTRNPSLECPVCDFQKPDCCCAISDRVANDEYTPEDRLIDKMLGVYLYDLYLGGHL